MNDIWVCSACKSINRQRDGRCYRCQGRREDAVGTEGPTLRVGAAVANRAARPYVSAWPLAALAGGLIITASLLGLLILVQQALGFAELKAAFLDTIDGRLRGAEPAILAAATRTAALAALRGMLAVLALLSFAGWLALATMNVPALGGGVPTRGPVRVFVYTLIPIWNLIKVPGMVQEVLYRVEPAAGGLGMVVVAWFGLVGSWLVSVVGSSMITAAGVSRIVAAGTLDEAAALFATMLDQAFVLGVLTELMIATGAVTLVVLMARIERRCAIRDREIRAAAGA